MFKADLHIHSTCSDGTSTPEEIIQLAAEAGLQGISITDHDTIDAYPKILELGKAAGIEVIPGAEFSCMHEGVSIHVLAYNFSLDSPELLMLCKRHAKRRKKRNLAILELLEKANMSISEDDIMRHCKAKHSIGRPHIALAMIEKGFVSSVQEAFTKYLGEGKPCYASVESISVRETLEIIAKAHGLSVLAHPHLIKQTALLPSLSALPFNGIECYYGKFTIGQNSRWLKLAKRKNWLVTGGSDYHGSIKPSQKLGCSFIGEDLFRALTRCTRQK